MNTENVMTASTKQSDVAVSVRPASGNGRKLLQAAAAVRRRNSLLIAGLIFLYALVVYGSWLTYTGSGAFAQNESNLVLFVFQQFIFLGTISLASKSLGFAAALAVWAYLAIITTPFAIMVVSQTPQPHLILEMFIIGLVGIIFAWLFDYHEMGKKQARIYQAMLEDELEDSISELQQEIIARKRQELFLHSILTNTHDGFWMVDTRGSIIRANKSYCQMSGYSEAELKALRVADVIVSDTAAQTSDRISQLINSGQDIIETRHRRKDGSVIDLEVSNNLLRHDGEVYFYSFFRDITERKQTQRQLETALAAEAREAREWQDTFDSVMDIVTVISPDLTFLKINRSGCEAVGKEAAELIGKKCYEVIHGTKAPIASCPCMRALKSGQPMANEVTDRGLTCLATAAPVFDEQGQIVAFTHTLKNITEMKLAEQENQQLREKAEIASRLAAVGEMAAGIAHEINNPLTSVIGFAELLLGRDDFSEEVREELKIINDGSLRVKDIVRRLLTFARQVKPVQVMSGISDLIDQTLDLRTYVLETSNIQVVRDYEPDLPWIIVDPGQIQQVFLNLIVNAEYAMKHTHGKGVLSITARKTDTHIRVMVTDDGGGMTDEVKDKLFNPFFTTKDPGEGTGLGLPLSVGIIREHGGTLTVDSRLGEGTTFIVELPLSQGDAATEVLLSPDDEVPAGAKSARILVIDDEPSVRALIRTVLTQEGHVIDDCDNPHEALTEINSKHYDIIFMDVRMPGMSGMELHAQVSAARPDISRRIAFITGDTFEATPGNTWR
jgi:PAS domain S-box-containing protein